MSPGRFITIEGGEAAGKSTQTRHLAAALAQLGLDVLATREPGGAAEAEALRGLLLAEHMGWTPLAETLLHYAARAQHVARVIRPALAAGRWVVCDRFSDSTLAYQGYGLGVDHAAIAALSDMLGLWPDLTLVLDLPAEDIAGRLAGRGAGADRYERMGEAFFARVGQGFRAIAAAAPARCVLLSATPPEALVTRAILAAVAERFGLAL